MAVSRREFFIVELIEMIAIIVLVYFLYKVYKQLIPEEGYKPIE